ncbi:type II toxin-antitoxin system Phd/YefM family antitoxin [Actinomadura sp. 7K507]|nr:type II toxin-antitoxin system Phd/YefM family antitoxin [Actinomadura sp. 7K507]
MFDYAVEAVAYTTQSAARLRRNSTCVPSVRPPAHATSPAEEIKDGTEPQIEEAQAPLTTLPNTQARMMFKELVDHVAYRNAPVRLTRRDKVMVGMVSAEDYEPLMAYRDEMARHRSLAPAPQDTPGTPTGQRPKPGRC